MVFGGFFQGDMSDAPQNTDRDRQTVPVQPTRDGAATDAQSVYARFLAALDQLVTLKIVTIVGGPELIDRNGQPVGTVTVNDKAPNIRITPEIAVATCIDLVQGDVRTFVPPDFFEPARAELRTFHTEQVRIGREIVEKNVGALASAAESLRKHFQGTSRQ